ncbi:hypothetical protein PHYSODRAFT_341894 [Phytophthora sojae]|uniref:Uncharacterized protein n=1 Tax=Phytophthora sojae (strain P6497) TaxID=1094619 RepID=G5AEP6_PHYSP|nr:hypothetical protein PHYSODRAFT_341894 [Phytophthora sojae]EGZ05686.1 hypothetical protein PHYSODRAFT_341894 [Phytophthora sojae]|eukprot:XP_009538547.1 hypothetical protein PHYSODRAFT_341894 [Phytophthora sojae]
MPNTIESLSESDRASVLPESTKTKEHASDYQLNIGVHRFRAVVGSLLMACLLIGTMLPFAREGLRVDSFEADEMSAAEQKKMLDKYNSISGGLTVLVSKPLDVFLSMVVSVAFLCLAAKTSIHHENRRRYLAMGVIGGVGYLMNTGFSALNVQVVSGKIRPRIISSDLSVENVHDNTQPLDGDRLLTTTRDAKFRESAPSNSVHNTILRNLFTPTENVPTWCNHSVSIKSPLQNVVAYYGFPSRSWQQRALSRALEPTVSMDFPMSSSAGDLPSNDDLPMNISIATNLVVYAVVVSNSFLGWWSEEDEVWSSRSQGFKTTKYSKPLVMAEYLNLTKRSSANATFVSDVQEVVADYFGKAGHANITDELARLAFSRLDLSETVVFDAFTIEIPTQKIGQQEDNSSESNPFYETLKGLDCNPEACIVNGAKEFTEGGNETTIYPRVQALAICLNNKGTEDLAVDMNYYNPDQYLQNCTRRSTTSMMIVNIGKRIEGDSFEAS